jgi:4-aminobutyrate aminotransferase-like enzyme
MNNRIHVVPPITISAEQAEHGLGIIDDTLASL